MGRFVCRIWKNVAGGVLHLSWKNDDGYFEISISMSSGASSLTSRIASRRGDQRRIAAENRDLAHKFWVPPGTSVKVAGITIPGGMVYVGTGLRSVDSEWAAEPALIDPKQRVARSISSDVYPDIPHYWSTYDSVNPVTRRAYLQWLADGRRTPGAPMPLVWMFFYGLERRLLDDLIGLWSDHPEVDVLAAEVRALADVYGADTRFHGHAMRLLGVLDAARGVIEPWRDSTTDWDLPLGLRLELGTHAAAGTPIDGELALHWAVHHPEIYLRTPALRCRPQFDAVFQQLYAKRQQPITPRGSNEIRLTYYPATQSMYNVETIKLPGSVDVAGDARARGALKRLVTRATDQLDAYSRWMGREHVARDSLAALSVYPAGVDFDDATQLHVDRFKTSLGYVSAVADPQLVPAAELFEHFPVRSASKPTAKEVEIIAESLARLGIAMVPDPQAGERWVNGHDPVLYTRADTPRRRSAAAEELRSIANVLGSLTGQIIQAAPAERTSLVDALAHEIPGSARNDGENRRVGSAYATYGEQSKLTSARLRKLVEPISEDLRGAVVTALVRIASRAGAVTHESIHRLDEVSAVLGVESAHVHRMLHAAASATLDAPNWKPRPDAASDTRSTQVKAERGINTQTADRLMRESKKLTARLDAILTTDDEPAAEPAPAKDDSGSDASTQTGALGDAYVRMLRAVLDRSSVSRVEFEQLARDSDVFPDAAIEAINEYALDAIGDILLDGDDPIDVIADIAEELRSSL